MLVAGFRAGRTQAELIRTVTSGSRNPCQTLITRHLSTSTPVNARLPYFHKKLTKKTKPTVSDVAAATTPTTSPSTSPVPKTTTSNTSNTTLSDSQSTISKRQSFKSITPSPQLMHEIRVQGLGTKAETWSFAKSSGGRNGNKTIRPWDKKLPEEEWKRLKKETRLPPKQVWFEQQSSKVVEKEQVKFPGMRFVAGASSLKSLPSEDALLRMFRPDLFEEIEEIENLLLEESGGNSKATSGDEGSGTKKSMPIARVPINSDDVQKLHERKRAKVLEIRDSALQEIAIVGRSNVGKSTMLNTLTESPNTARVSSKPGLTRQLNFYRCSDKFVLVDMPGYGFAFAKEEDKTAWTELIDEYLATRKTLKRIYVMIDARHGLKVADKEFLTTLDKKSKKFQVILTKCDLVTPPDLARCYTLVQEELKKSYRNAITERLLMVSSYTGAGMNNLRKDMLFVCGQNILVRERERPRSTIH
ncbi:hypothetical protein BG011_005199 [Mortierella polycephala]|uniref:EngB-type G domain-containing protein n=1 Tax=Mortierella polycephala TaxID=41804 RepID=A0A9P6PWP4_9FUNG|nr:hypothetical protein BG011_005199 [Mortierella polycephala]